MTTRLASRSVSRASRKGYPFVVRVEGARSVVVTGGFTNWSKEGIPLREIRMGEWATNLDLAPGDYEYRLLVDGEWRDNVEADRRTPNPFGTENCLLTIS